MKAVHLGLFLPILVPLCLYFAAPSFVSEHFTVMYGADREELPVPRRKELVEKNSRGVDEPIHRDQTDQNKKQTESKSKLELPKYVIDHIKTFVFFLGFAHTGHSIVGSLMDSHPHMVISHEVDIFTKLSQGLIAPTKTAIFNTVWKNTVKTIIHGTRAQNNKGYNLTVNNLYEGSYVDHIDVIGDKKGGRTTQMLLRQPEQWLSVFNTLKTLNVTIKVILVFRNPYDTIASTVLLASHSKPNYVSIKQSNTTIETNPDQINSVINHYFTYLQAIVNAKKTYNLDIIEIHGKDLILDPRGTLSKLCNDLGVICYNNYLDICSKKIYKTESRTRRLIKWNIGSLKMMKQNIKKYSSLKGYSFDSL